MVAGACNHCLVVPASSRNYLSFRAKDFDDCAISFMIDLVLWYDDS
jgi:hypothetical protein